MDLAQIFMNKKMPILLNLLVKAAKLVQEHLESASSRVSVSRELSSSTLLSIAPLSMQLSVFFYHYKT